MPQLHAERRGDSVYVTFTYEPSLSGVVTEDVFKYKLIRGRLKLVLSKPLQASFALERLPKLRRKVERKARKAFRSL